MKKLLLCAPLMLMIVFELFVGINLFNDPVTFTQNVIVVFGVFMIVLGVLGLIRWLRNGHSDTLTLVGSIIDLAIGIICVADSGTVIKLFPILAMIYGVAMVIMGFYKVRNYLTVRQLGFHRPFMALLGGILTIVLGVIIFIHPFTAMELIWQYTGIMLIAEAVFDIATLILGVIIL